MKMYQLIVPALLLTAVAEAQNYKKPVPYPYVREADVMWTKRVWQVIDLREKFNQTLYYPLSTTGTRESLFEIIKQGVLPREGVPALAAYSSLDGEFKTRVKPDELKRIFSKSDTVYGPDINDPTRYVNTVVNEELSAADIRQYWIQEEWFFDKQRSVMDVRILAIMPVIEKKNEQGDAMGMAATFWVSFAELRPLLAQHNIFNTHNEAQPLSYDDLFIKRMYSCYIIKEDNPADRMIAEYTGGNTLNSLLEGEAIKNKIMFKEQDMWQH
jgi:gliding motility associated protien GldN